MTASFIKISPKNIDLMKEMLYDVQEFTHRPCVLTLASLPNGLSRVKGQADIMLKSHDDSVVIFFYVTL